MDDMQWVTNVYDIKHANWRVYVSTMPNQTVAQAEAAYVTMFELFVQGPPKPTAARSLEQLTAMGIVGLYQKT